MRTNHKRACCQPAIEKQQGIVLVVLAVILALGITAILIGVVNADSLKIGQQEIVSLRLAEAKDALIARSVNDDNRPGSLPCPDTNGDGSAELFVGNACPSYIGLFPWKTLGVSKLTDASGQVFWYVLSPGFRDHSVVEPLNSNSVGTLSLDGALEPVIALVIAPGNALANQSRSAVINIPADIPDYLDLENSDADSDYVSIGPAQTFNDRVIAVSGKDIFPLVEKVVLATVGRNLESFYTDNWQRLPFAALFNDASFEGEDGLLQGSLPIRTPLTWTDLDWSITSGFALINCVGAGLPVTGDSISFSCDLVHIGPANFRIVLDSDSLGMGFFSRMDLSDAEHTGPASLDFTSLTQTLQSDGTGRVTINGEKAGAFGNVNFTVTVTQRRPDDWNEAESWIWKNDWHELIFYGATSSFVAGGDTVCAGDCNSVNLITTTGTTMVTDIPAVLMMSGAKLNATESLPPPDYDANNPAQVRPTNALKDYFDSVNNNNPGALIFDHRPRVDKYFNDQVLSVTVP